MTDSPNKKVNSNGTTNSPDGLRVADLVGNYLGQHKNSINNRTQARLGMASKGLVQHLLGTNQHHAAEKIQGFMRKPVMISAKGVKYPYIPKIHSASKIQRDIIFRDEKLVEQGTGKVIMGSKEANKKFMKKMYGASHQTTSSDAFFHSLSK